MSRNFANEDFGSEEEDDDFNPAPANESDHEEADEKVCVGLSPSRVPTLLMIW